MPRLRNKGRRRAILSSGAWEQADLRIRVVRQGIKRQPRPSTAARLAPSDRHQQVLAVLGSEPRGATAIARELGIKPAAANSALYALSARGLVERVLGQGWVVANERSIPKTGEANN